MVKDNSLQTPGYVSFHTFRAFVKLLKDADTIPPQIDSHVFGSSMSGGTQSQLRGTLRSLGLTDGSDQPTERLRQLVGAYGTEAWKEELAQLTGDAYSGILANVDLDNGTLKQLRDAFSEKGGARGSILEKSVRFYLSAQKDAGVKLSPFIAKARASTPSRPAKSDAPKPKRRAKKPRVSGEHAAQTPPPIPEGWKMIPFVLPDRDRPVRLEVPVDLTADDWGMVRDYVERYFKKSWSENKKSGSEGQE